MGIGQSTPDITIVGGGIIGCMLAWELTGRGMTVELLERQDLAREASWASAGIISPPSPRYGVKADLALRSYRRYPSLIEEIQATTGIDVGYAQTGEVDLGDDVSRDTLLQAIAWQREHGMRVEWLSSQDEIREREPAIEGRWTCGIAATEAGSVVLARLTTALARAASTRGAIVREHTPVTGLVTTGGRVVALRTFAGERPVGAIIVAAGAWSRTLGDALDLSIPTIPVRGQMLAIADPPIPLRSVVTGGGAYLVPRADGTIAVGATEEHDAGFDSSVTPAGMAQLVERIAGVAPSLNRGKLAATWAGLRPGTADGEAIIGRVPHLDNAWVATGHFRSGALLAPGTAELLANSIVSGSVDAALAPFDPGRFS
ncbi:MAG: glycine oxidase ThiO [Thermomicrobiales bacterium]|jgi:glycine oxidase